MFDTQEIAQLDAARACEAILSNQERLREQEWRELELAAHWAICTTARRCRPGVAGGCCRGQSV